MEIQVNRRSMTVERNASLITGLILGFILGAITAALVRSDARAQAQNRVRARVDDLDVETVRAQLSERVQSSAAKGRDAVAAGQNKAADLITRSPLPVSFSNDNGQASDRDEEQAPAPAPETAAPAQAGEADLEAT